MINLSPSLTTAPPSIVAVWGYSAARGYGKTAISPSDALLLRRGAAFFAPARDGVCPTSTPMGQFELIA